MGKQIQIDEQIFFDLCEYFIWQEFPDDKEKITRDIEKALQEKIDKILDRLIFTEYKTASTPGLREEARKKYLDRRGVPGRYQSEKEIRHDE